MKKTIILVLTLFLFQMNNIFANSLENQDESYIKLIDDIPELYSGQYEFDYSYDDTLRKVSQKFQDNEKVNRAHKAATIKVKVDLNNEQKKNLLNGEGRKLHIYLDDVSVLSKFIQIRIKNSNINIDGNYILTDNFKASDKVILKYNEIVINDIDMLQKHTIEFELESWISIAAATEHKLTDLQLSMKISNTDIQCNKVPIAKPLAAFCIETPFSDTKLLLGTENHKISDIIIKENFPGAFNTGNLAINIEHENPSMAIGVFLKSTPTIHTEGDLEISYTTGITNNFFSGDINLNVDKCSKKVPSTIIIENLYLDTGSVMSSTDNKGEFYVNINGSAVAENYLGVSFLDSPFFISNSANSKYFFSVFYNILHPLLNDNLKNPNTYVFTINKKYINEIDFKSREFSLVNSIEIEEAPYLSEVSGSVMISATDFAKLYNMNISYNAQTKEVTLIDLDNNEIKFKLNDSKVVFNNRAHNIYTPKGEDAFFEVKNDKVFLPINYVTNIFNISIRNHHNYIPYNYELDSSDKLDMKFDVAITLLS